LINENAVKKVLAHRLAGASTRPDRRVKNCDKMFHENRGMTCKK
jgi:hypothetical protein